MLAIIFLHMLESCTGCTKPKNNGKTYVPSITGRCVMKKIK